MPARKKNGVKRQMKQHKKTDWSLGTSGDQTRRKLLTLEFSLTGWEEGKSPRNSLTWVNA